MKELNYFMRKIGFFPFPHFHFPVSVLCYIFLKHEIGSQGVLMAESFEAGLMKAGSKENFKKAKHILHHGGLLCCMEFVPGVLRAVCRDGDGPRGI